MNINESLKQWIEENQGTFDSLDGVDVLAMGDTGDISPPCITITESGVAQYVEGGLTMYGVATYTITVELHTVPAEVSEDGTPKATAQKMRFDLYDILGNRDAIDYINGLNFWTVFDIRATAPNTEAEEGRMISRYELEVVCAPQ